MPIDAQRVQAVFLEATELEGPAERDRFLDGACDGDPELRSRVEALLRAHDQRDTLLDQPTLAPHDPGTDRTIALEGGETGHDEVPLGFLGPATRPDSLGRIGHYEVLQVLGQGGFGIVFRAFDDVLHRVVAVKVLAPQMAATSPARKRFLREARSSAQVRHENVVQVYEVGEQPLPYIAMEFIPGETLQQRLDRTGPVDVAEVVRIGRQIAEGLAAAHATDLIHRDIKPGNILLEGGQLRVKITDFGLARAADDASISQSGLVAGTPMYMAPEQAKGETLDQRADLFSLGSVLYQMAAGRPPFRANGTVAVLKRVAEDTPRDIREVVPEVPPWLCAVIAKLHAKNPDERYQSAREVADVLADCEAQLKASSKLTDFSRIPRRKPQHSGWRKWVMIAACALPLLAGVFVVLMKLKGWGNTPITQQKVQQKVQHVPNADGWVSLFNGKDLTGWKPLPAQPGTWQVIDGILVGSNGPGQLYSVRDDYQNFHLRAEVAVDWNGGFDQAGDADIYFRAKRQPPGVGTRITGRSPAGYAADITWGPGSRAGTISFRNPLSGTAVEQPARTMVRPGDWFTLEVIADGNNLITKINGASPVEFVDSLNAYQKGHIALRVWLPIPVLKVRKIEIKELPPSPPASPPAPEVKIPATDPDRRAAEYALSSPYLLKAKVEVNGQERDIHAVGDLPREPFRLIAAAIYGVQVDDKGMANFEGCTHLMDLVLNVNNIDGPVGLTDAGLAYLKDCKHLKSLTLDSPAITDAGLAYFKDCKDLTSVSISGVGVTGAGLVNFRECKNLTALSLRSPITGAALAHVGGFKNLARLDLTGTASTDAGLTHLEGLTNLTDLNLSYARKITDAGLAHLKGATGLTHLNLSSTGVTGAGLAHLQGYTGLTHLNLSETQITDAGLAHLRNCKGLLDVDLTRTPVGDAGIAAFRDFGKLESLKLESTQVGDGGLAELKGCKGLKVLALDHTRVTNAGLASLKNLTGLNRLQLSRTRVSDAGLADIAGLENLTWLALPSTKVTSQGVRGLARRLPRCTIQWDDGVIGPNDVDRHTAQYVLDIGGVVEVEIDGASREFKAPDVIPGSAVGRTRLTRVDLGDNLEVMDAALEKFKGCQNLNVLDLTDTLVTDAGLVHLAGLGGLTDLLLVRTKVTATGIEGLAKALPRCKITWDGGVTGPK